MKYKQLYIIGLLFLSICIFTRCGVETYATKKLDANNDIYLYISENGLDVTPEPSGLVFIPIVKGNGDCPKSGDKVAFHYKGYYMNGDVFDSSYEKSYPVIAELGKGLLISGIEEALMKMNKSSKSKVIIPFYLAYKDMESAPVPPYSNLIFDIELIDYTKSAD